MSDKTLIAYWERHQDQFGRLSKEEFDALVRDGEFVEGPLRTDLTDFMQEFGPYSPRRHALGKLRDGRLIFTQIQ